MNESKQIKAARIISGIFNPFLIPFGAFLVLFFFSYLRLLQLQYKLIVLAVVYSFTILIPMLAIFLFQKINGEGITALSDRKKRLIPYFLTFTAYAFCLVLMNRLGTPSYLSGIILATLISIIICVLVNLAWKISVHMTGIGGIVGGIIAFGMLFNYNPVGWLCLFILLAGMLGTARMILREHSLGQVLLGFANGFICAILGILFMFFLNINH